MSKIEVHFFFRKPSPAKHSIERLFDVIALHLPQQVHVTNVYSRFSSKGFFPRFFSALDAAFRQASINHITGDIHFFAAFLQSKRTVLTIHDVEVLKRTFGWKHRIIKYFWYTMPIRRVAKLTVISEFSARELLHFVPEAQKKLIVIPNAISSAYVPIDKIFNSEKPIILQIGTKHNKNIERVVDALKGITCKLFILGALSQNQEELLRKSYIEYQLFGNLSLAEVVDLYAKCDFLLFASTYEGFGLPILEAQAVGRPVICSNVASMPDVAGDAALLVNPLDVSDIRAKVMMLIASADLRNALVNNGFENVKRYSAKEIANAYFLVYKELIS